MKIKYIEKTSLVDYPGKIACTLFFFGCNFKCGFCYNPELVIEEKTFDLTEKEILDFLEKRKNQLEGVCLTGGEPLISLEKDFLKKIKNFCYSIKIDTNGSFPEKLKEFLEENLVDYVAMDIKGIKEDYEKITNSKIGLRKIEESMKIVSSLKNYEFRTTFVPRFHNEEKIIEEIKWINSVIKKKIKNFALQGFKNFGKFIDMDFKNERNANEKELNYIKEKIINLGLVENFIIRV